MYRFDQLNSILYARWSFTLKPIEISTCNTTNKLSPKKKFVDILDVDIYYKLQINLERFQLQLAHHDYHDHDHDHDSIWPALPSTWAYYLRPLWQRSSARRGPQTPPLAPPASPEHRLLRRGQSLASEKKKKKNFYGWCKLE